MVEEEDIPGGGGGTPAGSHTCSASQSPSCYSGKDRGASAQPGDRRGGGEMLPSSRLGSLLIDLRQVNRKETNLISYGSLKDTRL